MLRELQNSEYYSGVSTFGFDDFSRRDCPKILVIFLFLLVCLVSFSTQEGNFKTMESRAGGIFLTNRLPIYPLCKVQLIFKGYLNWIGLYPIKKNFYMFHFQHGIKYYSIFIKLSRITYDSRIITTDRINKIG